MRAQTNGPTLLLTTPLPTTLTTLLCRRRRIQDLDDGTLSRIYKNVDTADDKKALRLVNKRSKALVDAHCITRVTNYLPSRDFGPALQHWGRLRYLSVHGTYPGMPDDIVNANLPRLTELWIEDFPGDRDMADALICSLAKRGRWPSLKVLCIQGCQLTETAATALANSSFWPHLDDFSVDVCFSDGALQTLQQLAKAPSVLRHLRLARFPDYWTINSVSRPLEPDSMELIAATWPTLQGLFLPFHGITPACQAMAALTGLTALNLSGGHRRGGGEGLLTPPKDRFEALTALDFPALNILILSGNRNLDFSLLAAATRRSWSRLERLELEDTRAGDADMVVLAAGCFERLTYLNLAANEHISPEGVYTCSTWCRRLEWVDFSRMDEAEEERLLDEDQYLMEHLMEHGHHFWPHLKLDTLRIRHF